MDYYKYISSLPSDRLNIFYRLFLSQIAHLNIM